MTKFLKIIDDLNLKPTDEVIKRYNKLCIEYIDNYKLCLCLMKKKDAIETIKKLQKLFGRFQNGIIDYQLIYQINQSKIEKI